MYFLLDYVPEIKKTTSISWIIPAIIIISSVIVLPLGLIYFRTNRYVKCS